MHTNYLYPFNTMFKAFYRLQQFYRSTKQIIQMDGISLEYRVFVIKAKLSFKERKKLLGSSPEVSSRHQETN